MILGSIMRQLRDDSGVQRAIQPVRLRKISDDDDAFELKGTGNCHEPFQYWSRAFFGQV